MLWRTEWVNEGQTDSKKSFASKKKWVCLILIRMHEVTLLYSNMFKVCLWAIKNPPRSSQQNRRLQLKSSSFLIRPNIFSKNVYYSIIVYFGECLWAIKNPSSKEFLKYLRIILIYFSLAYLIYKHIWALTGCSRQAVAIIIGITILYLDGELTTCT